MLPCGSAFAAAAWIRSLLSSFERTRSRTGCAARRSAGLACGEVRGCRVAEAAPSSIVFRPARETGALANRQQSLCNSSGAGRTVVGGKRSAWLKIAFRFDPRSARASSGARRGTSGGRSVAWSAALGCWTRGGRMCERRFPACHSRRAIRRW